MTANIVTWRTSLAYTSKRFERILEDADWPAQHWAYDSRHQAMRMEEMLHGVSWALSSGRVGLDMERAIGAMDDAAMFALLCTLERECGAMGDVPRWLNGHLGTRS